MSKRAPAYVSNDSDVRIGGRQQLSSGKAGGLRGGCPSKGPKVTPDPAVG